MIRMKAKSGLLFTPKSERLGHKLLIPQGLLVFSAFSFFFFHFVLLVLEAETCSTGFAQASYVLR